MRVMPAIMGAAALAVSGAAAAQVVDLSSLDREMSGPRTQVLVLGTVHLRYMPEEFERESLEPILDRLAAYRPDIITIESISGEQCDMAARHPAIYGEEGLAPYCKKADAARAATGLDVPAAIAEVKTTLDSWPESPTPAQRRRLASLFMASNENASALVQWLQLPASERHAGDGLDDTLVTILETATEADNESYQIAARLAARLGLQRLYPIDDHTGDNVAVTDVTAYGAAIQHAWDQGAEAVRPFREQEKVLRDAGDMLGLYRHINRPEVLRAVIESDFGAAMRDASPESYPRYYVGGWETRNLRMIANIRSTFRERPGARVLSIVGATHKPWLIKALRGAVSEADFPGSTHGWWGKSAQLHLEAEGQVVRDPTKPLTWRRA